MNERIRDLQIQAFTECKTFEDDKVRTDDVFERFAELIVRECAEVCYHHSEMAGGVGTAFGYGYKDCGNDIKQHFGVEE